MVPFTLQCAGTPASAGTRSAAPIRRSISASVVRSVQASAGSAAGVAHAAAAARPAATAAFTNGRWMRAIVASPCIVRTVPPYQRPAAVSRAATVPDRPPGASRRAHIIAAPDASSRRTARARSHPGAGRPLLRHDARRHGGRGAQDRGARARRRHPRLGAAPRRLEHLLPGPEPKQEERRAGPEVRGRRGRAAPADRDRRRADRELPAGEPGEARLQLPSRGGAESAARLLLGHRLRADRSEEEPSRLRRRHPGRERTDGRHGPSGGARRRASESRSPTTWPASTR